MKKLIHATLWLVLFLVASLAKANDDFNNYFADLYLNESHQFRAPDTLIKYRDADNGPLLKSVLNPKRAKVAITVVYQETRRGTNTANALQSFTPLLNRYQSAFKAQGSKYEDEYLDSIEISAILLAGSVGLLNQSSVGNASAKELNPQAPDEKKLIESMGSMMKSLSSLNNTLRQNLAATLREQVKLGKFSQDGAKRAASLAATIEAPY